MSVLVTVSGVDLAGKTTQLDELQRWLSEEGRLDATRLWFRPGYSSGLDRVRATVRALRPGALPSAGPSANRDQAFAKPGVRNAWIAMAAADALVHYGVRVRAAVARHDVVLSDRWVDDAQFDFQLRFPDLDAARLGRTFRAVAPEPALAVLLVLPWDEVMRRLDAKPEPFPDPLELRRRRFEAYERLAESGRYQIVDATRPIDVVQEELRGMARRHGIAADQHAAS